jgi:hypothetical protein
LAWERGVCGKRVGYILVLVVYEVMVGMGEEWRGICEEVVWVCKEGVGREEEEGWGGGSQKGTRGLVGGSVLKAGFGIEQK